MIDRHKIHKEIMNPHAIYDWVLCGNRHAKLGALDNNLVTCKACQRLINEQRKSP
jgi:hypothetical protein